MLKLFKSIPKLYQKFSSKRTFFGKSTINLSSHHPQTASSMKLEPMYASTRQAENGITTRNSTTLARIYRSPVAINRRMIRWSNMPPWARWYCSIIDWSIDFCSNIPLDFLFPVFMTSISWSQKWYRNGYLDILILFSYKSNPYKYINGEVS